MTTNELLRRYVSDRSDAAFAELVSQHIDLVYSAALRQVNGDMPAAQDVTQAVFTDLARKAPALTRHTSLTGWLYTSTRYLAAHARRAEQRRRTHEQEAHAMNQLLQSIQPDPVWQDLRPLLDEAMHELSPADREAVLLRYFERLPLAQIGAKLGLTENTARKRVDRAIAKLRAALAKRGVTSTVTALAALLSERAVGAAPAGLSVRVSSLALATAATGTGLGWALFKLAGLLKGNALLTAGAATLVAGFIVVPKWFPNGTTVMSEGNAVVARGTSIAAARTGREASSASAATSTINKITLYIVAADTEQPVADATVEYYASQIGRSGTTPLLLTRLTATDQGVCEIPVSRGTAGLLLIQSRTDGFVDTSIGWRPDHGETIPQQYTLRLAPSVPISGQVMDDEGQPVGGAEVQVHNQILSSTGKTAEPPHFSSQASEKTVADSNGRWRIDRFAKEAISTISGFATHPNYFTEPVISYNGGNSEVEKQLLAGTRIFKLTRGITAHGMVVDADGHFVTGAKVSAIAEIKNPVAKQDLVPGQSVTVQRVDRIETTNLDDGTFALTGCRPGTNQFSVEAGGFALTSLRVNITNDPAPLRFVLQPGHVLRLRVLDANGLPATNCRVSLESGRGVRPGFTYAFVGTLPDPASSQPGRSVRPGPVGPRRGRGSSGNMLIPGQPRIFRPDTEGRVVWESSPEAELQLDFQVGGLESTNMLVPADGEEHVVTLTPRLQTPRR